MYPKPLKIADVPRVIISGWIFSEIESNPLIAPSPVPTNRMRGIANPGSNFHSAIMIAKRTLRKDDLGTNREINPSTDHHKHKSNSTNSRKRYLAN